MLKFLNKYKKIIIIFSFVYIYLLLILIFPSKKQVLTPGEATKVNNIYNIENIEINENFNTLSVYNWYNVTIFQKWITENNLRYNQSDISKTLTRKDIKLQGKISNDSSHNNALITAYTYASKKNSNIYINYQLKSLTVYNTNNDKLLIGDEIISINDETINTNSYEDYLTNLNIYNENRYLMNNNLNIEVLRKDEKLNIILNKDEFILFYPKYEIIDSNPLYKGFKENLNVSGPSGGMMQTIALYYSLLNKDLGNLKIAGTGTIETNNSYSVGNIGGEVQKYFTSLNYKMDYLFLPKDNYNDLKLEVGNFDKSIKVYPVITFDDLIEQLEVIENA